MNLTNRIVVCQARAGYELVSCAHKIPKNMFQVELIEKGATKAYRNKRKPSSHISSLQKRKSCDMKFSSSALAALVITDVQITNAFTVPSPSFARNAVSLRASSEFDFILQEGVHVENALMQKTVKQGIDTNYIIGIPDTSAAATLTSSVTFEEASGMASDMDLEDENDADGSFNYLSEETEEGETQTSDPRLAEILRKEKQQMAMKSQPPDTTPLSVKTLNYLKGKDFGEIFFTVLVPVIGGYYFVKKAYEKVSDQVETKADDTLDAYANEMIYHNGDFEEMKLAHLDYGKKLMFLGPKKNDAMLKRYLEFYAKKVTVSPQAIRLV